MWRYERLHGSDDMTSIALESISGVIKAYPKDAADKRVRGAVQQQFVDRVVDYACASDETRTEDAIVALLQKAVVTNKVGDIIRAVRHHDRDCIACGVL